MASFGIESADGDPVLRIFAIQDEPARRYIQLWKVMRGQLDDRFEILGAEQLMVENIEPLIGDSLPPRSIIPDPFFRVGDENPGLADEDFRNIA